MGRKGLALTLRPIHLMVPTSFMVNGDRILLMDSILSVIAPGLNTDVPLKTVTFTSSPLRTAAPTSRTVSTG